MTSLHHAVSHAHASNLEISDVHVSYGQNAVLKNVNLSIKPGEFFAFLGPSGCGKTTLLRLIAGFNQANRGSIKVGGKDISALPPWRRDVGMVFQSYALWPHMNVARNVAFGLEERGVPKAEITKRVQAALDLVGLSDYAQRLPSQLSGGQQQRVALARTIVIEPKILLLDELLSNLDAKMRVEVRRELRDLQQRLGVTTIFVTHDQEEANAICDRMAVMNEGIIQQVGTPRELYERPANLFVANFLGHANVLRGTVEGSGHDLSFTLRGGERLMIREDAHIPEDARLVLRPQAFSLARGTANGSWTGTVQDVEFLGAIIRYRVSLNQDDILVDASFRPGDEVYAPGEQVSVSFDSSSAVWLSQ